MTIKNSIWRTPFSALNTGKFFRDESGAMTIFTCFMIFMMVLVCGIGVDLMRNEMERTRLQGVSDRAVLAAASLDQQRPPEEVVRDYFDKSGLGSFVSSVDVDETLGARRVTVSAFHNMNTQFMHLVGVDTLPVPALSTAEQFTPNVEISLVLDISQSMLRSGKIENLRPAASDFVDVLLTGDGNQATTINLVPYAGHVNPGAFMFDRLGGQRLPVAPLDEARGGIPEHLSHGFLPAGAVGGVGSDPSIRYVHPNVSSCLETTPADATSVGLPSAGVYSQVPHFMNYSFKRGLMDWGWCPHDTETEILYMSSDADVLKDRIANMSMNDGTGTQHAIKYGLGLLDPSSRGDITALIGNGDVDASYSGRPAAYSDADTAKYIVLMTDGAIVAQYRPTDELDDQNATVNLSRGSRKAERVITSQKKTNIQQFLAQCDLAKNRSPRPVIVFTIAFEASAGAANEMRRCATSPSHFFIADGTEISVVFQNIAQQISQLRLTN